MANKSDEIINEVQKVIHGKEGIIRLTLSAILGGGHVLLEDIPGMGKTTLALALSKTMDLDYKRTQFTPDVLPSDICGFNMYDKELGEFRFIEGSIYTNLFLADEINRTSPKTQSALLEVMEEGCVSVEGVTRTLDKPFFVIATENPFGSSGTQKLPESQLDRFMICLSIGYPDRESAIKILKNNSSDALLTVNRVVSKEELLIMQQEAENVEVSERLYDYIINLTEKTRNPAVYDLGLSPRGSISLLKMAKAYAYCNNRSFITPDDIMDVFIPVCIHRVHLSSKSKAGGLMLINALQSTLKSVPIPGIE